MSSFHTIIEFANDRGLVHLLLQAVLWALDRQELFAAFLFPESRDLLPDQLFDFLIALKQTLISAARLAQAIDALLLFPPAVLRRADRRQLSDLALVLEHQIALNPAVVPLFERSVNKTAIVAKLFAAEEFERGCALARLFRVDIDEVLIEACARVSQSDDAALCRFLLGVIPRVELESANRLIEALASVLVRNRGNAQFVGRLVAGTRDLRNVFQILRWFGSRELAAVVGFTCGFRPEMEELEREARKRKDTGLARRINRWLSQFHGFS